MHRAAYEHRTVATFSIVAVDEASGDLGVATASRYIAVGSLVPHVEAETAAIATQSVAHPALAARMLKELSTGDASAQETLLRFLSYDRDRETRQLAVVTASGDTAAFTGSECLQYAGAQTGHGVVCAGNTLAGPAVLQDMLREYENREGRLWTRLLCALTAGEAAGGDKRGKQAAALRVHRTGGGYRGSGEVVVDLRVDDDAEPIRALSRLLESLKQIRDSEPDGGLST